MDVSDQEESPSSSNSGTDAPFSYGSTVIHIPPPSLPLKGKELKDLMAQARDLMAHRHSPSSA